MEPILKEESYKILGACFEVYKEKGSGFLEPVCHDCLVIELGLQSTPFISKRPINLFYKGQPIQHHYEPDFICYNGIIVEIKAVSKLVDEHRAQLINYLKATGMKLGYLINFGHFPKLEYERFVN